MEFDPEALDVRTRYGLLISVVQPRPIAWVSTVDAAGRRNLAPFSFFTGITAAPMTVCFCPVRNRHGGKKDTLLNVEENAKAMVATSADVERGVDEFALAGLTAVPSAVVKPPRVGESPVALECELLQVVTVSEGALGGNLVIGRVVHVHVEDRVWKDSRISHKDLKAVGRLEGSWYCRTTDDFEIPRPGGGA